MNRTSGKSILFRGNRLAIAVGAAMAISSSVALAGPFSAVYFFGDSLSDSGQFPDTSTMNGATPVAGVSQGIRFTNRGGNGAAGTYASPNPTLGVWTQFLSAGLGLDASNSNPSTPLLPKLITNKDDGNNYAVGGYVVSQVVSSITSTNGSVVNTGSSSRTKNGYLVDHPVADPNALYVVWAGGNDVRAVLGGGANNLTTDASTLINSGVVPLADAGAKYILVMNLPDIGLAPGVNNPAGTGLSSQFNSSLMASISASGKNVVVANTFTLLQEIVNNASAYGFVHNLASPTCFNGTYGAFPPVACGTTDPVYGLSGTTPDATKLIFNDAIHPTSTTHAALASYALSILNAPGQISMLAAQPLNRAEALGTASNAIRSGEALKAGDLHVQGGVSGSKGSDSHNNASLADENSSNAVYATVSYDLSDNLRVGGLVGMSSGSTDWREGGSFDTDALYYGVFATGKTGMLEGDLVLAQTQLDFDTDRHIQLASATRSEKGSTSGDLTTAALNLRLNLADSEGLSAGPMLNVRSQSMSVDRLAETGTLATSMTFEAQDVDSVQVEAGLYVNASKPTGFGKVQFWANGARVTETKDDPQTVTASLNTLSSNQFKLPGYAQGETLNRVEVGVAAEAFTYLRTSLTLTAQNGITVEHGERALTWRLEGKF